MLDRMRWLVLLLAACIPPYRTQPLAANGASLACLDVWLDAEVGAQAEGPVVAIHLGNPCDHSTPVDLGAVRVVGLDGNGGTWPLEPYDPRHEIRSRRIDAFASGEEWIEYQAHGARPSLAWVDVDVGSIEHPAPARWIRLAVPR